MFYHALNAVKPRSRNPLARMQAQPHGRARAIRLARELEGDPLAGKAGPDPECRRQMRLPGAGRPEEHDVLLAVHEVELSEVEDQGLLHAALEAPVELLEGLAPGEPGGADPTLTTVRIARGSLRREERLGEALPTNVSALVSIMAGVLRLRANPRTYGVAPAAPS